MSATFDPNLPTLKDHIRLALGDKHNNGTSGTVANALLQDEAINAKLAGFSYQESLAQLAEALIAEFAQRPAEYGEHGGVQMKWSDRIEAWRRIADDARAGKIMPPNRYDVPRPRVGIAVTGVQAQNERTPRSVPRVPTLMEGFRSD